jgi:hypothetical protein
MSPKYKTKSRFECYHGTVPNIQNIRLLPMFSIILVYRKDKSTTNSEFVISLYVDDKNKLPIDKQFTYKTKDGNEKDIVTIGDKWTDFVIKTIFLICIRKSDMVSAKNYSTLFKSVSRITEIDHLRLPAALCFGIDSVCSAFDFFKRGLISV